MLEIIGSMGKIAVYKPSMKDEIYGQEIKHIRPFRFDEDVANCFDNMVVRSIPGYEHVQEILLKLIPFLNPTRIYDVGCSTGTLLGLLASRLPCTHLVGLDSSQSMIEKAREKTFHYSHVETVCELVENFSFQECELIICNYTLQFLSPEKRNEVLQKMAKALRPGGMLFLSEKIRPSPQFDEMFTKIYYDFKQANGYSPLEIAQKRKALEETLLPWSKAQYVNLLNDLNFKEIEELFCWMNFTTLLAVKC